MVTEERMPASAVVTRRDLEEYLSQALIDEYYFREEGQIVRQVSTSLKTYVLEIHPRHEGSGAVELFTEGGGIEASRTNEPSLWHLEWQGLSVFVDLFDPRYPLLHTIGLTNDSDRLVNRLTSNSGVDNCWYPTQWLREALDGQLISFRLFFQHGLEGLAESRQAEALRRELGRPVPPAFRLRVSDFIDAGDDLDALASNTQFGRTAALDSLAWRISDESDRFIHEEVWHQGKVSAYGTSWDQHLESVLRLQSRYRELISFIEADVVMSVNDGGLAGEPLTVRFLESPIGNVEALARSIADPRGPMKLLGVPQLLDSDYWAVEATDLHTLDRLSIEIGPEAVRIYLRHGSCGNVIPRMLVHIERHIAARLETSIDRLNRSAR